jgi:hypothetical protein
MAELALDDDQRHALVGHFDGMGVAQLMRRKAPPHATPRGVLRRSARAAALDHGRHRVAPMMTQNSGPTGSSTRAPIGVAWGTRSAGRSGDWLPVSGESGSARGRRLAVIGAAQVHRKA